MSFRQGSPETPISPLSSASYSSRFTVTPTPTTNVFTFPSSHLMDPSLLPTNSSYFTNPLYSPTSEEDALEGQRPSTLPLTMRTLDPNLLVSATAHHQEVIFDIQLEDVIDKAAESQQTSENEQTNDAKKDIPLSVSGVAAEWDKAVSSGEKDLDVGLSEWPLQLLKMIVYNVTFVLILSLAVGTKAITLLMTSMISANRPMKLCINNVTGPTMNPPIFPIIEENGNASVYASFSLVYEPESVQRIAWLWCLLFAATAPYFFSYFRSLRICFFRNFAVPQRATILTVFLAETLHIVGLSMLLFLILPNSDVIFGTMMFSSVCTVPSLLGLFVSVPTETESEMKAAEEAKGRTSSSTSNRKTSFKNAKSKRSSRFLGFTNRRFFAFFIAALQILSLAAWTVIDVLDISGISGRYYLVPVALFLVSFEWWENYIVPGQMMGRFGRFLDQTRQDLNTKNGRYFIGIFLYPWKVFLLLLLAFVHELVEHGWDVAWRLFSHFKEGFEKTDFRFEVDGYNETALPSMSPFLEGGNLTRTIDNGVHYMTETDPLVPLYFALSHIAASYACFWLTKYACQIWIQKISFAIPISLTVPLTVAILWEFTKVAQDDKCSLVMRFPIFNHIFWRDHLIDTFTFISSNEDWVYVFVAAIWYLGTQFPNTMQIWQVKNEKLAVFDAIFVSPKYNAVLLDQSLALNKRRHKVLFASDDDDRDSLSSASTPTSDAGSFQVSSSFSSPDSQPQPNNYLNDRRLTLAQIENAEFRAAQMKQEADWAREWAEICDQHGLDKDGIDPKPNPAEDDTVRIYACATMWHEDKREMLQMLKAVMRLDFDQAAKRIAKTQFNHENGDLEDHEYYELEVNIFFDAAFDQRTEPDGSPSKMQGDRVVNRFVETLLELMNEAATAVLGTRPKSNRRSKKGQKRDNLLVDWPVVIGTPFGGRLVWKLPGGNRLIAHLKDKLLIRDRKRWSQVMYMYYLLAHRLAARRDLNDRRKKRIANSTFILALDGDINFQPSAVHLVVDLMRKNAKLGAACGRIHPIGSGLMVWYQKFEYSIGHWFQKATEHVFGCVLCSPGCFSLFRARALMDDSVMHRYTTKSSEALHYVQFDQGEDRWLCTLLLQKGWRIEYCAASDSFTHAPEGFGEFYTQRRRWAPSTMANLIDLLSHFRQTVQVNENVSRLYILYQAFLMFGSLLSPATITLMIVTAMNSAMEMSLDFSIYSNLVVIASFTFVCYYLGNEKNHIKINFAMVLSTVYALLMLSVLVGTAIDMVKVGLFSPNSLFFTAMIGSFILAAILHPHEFTSVFLFPIYMLLIPSMYLLLTIYAITNLHIVSWGTREVKETPAPDSSSGRVEQSSSNTDESNKSSKDDEKSKTSRALDFLQYIDPRRQLQKNSPVNGLLSCLCCSNGSEKAENGMLNCSCCSSGGSSSSSVPESNLTLPLEEIREEITSLKTVVNQITSQLPGISISLPTTSGEFSLSPKHVPLVKQSSSHKTVEFQVEEEDLPETPEDDQPPSLPSEEGDFSDHQGPSKEFLEPPNNINLKPNTCDLPNVPKWILNHPKLRTFRRRKLPEREHLFWVGLIEKYLFPIKPDVKEQKRIESELITLRNKALFAMGFLNVLVVLAFFILQSHKDLVLSIPIGSLTDDEDSDDPGKVNKIEMHPIGFWLVLFFGSLLLIQCIGMILHRFSTLTQLLAFTTVNFWTKKEEKLANLVKRIIYDNSDANNRQKSSMLAEEEEEDESLDSEPSTVREDVLSGDEEDEDDGHDGEERGEAGGGDGDGMVHFDRRRRRRRSTHIQIDELFKRRIKKLESSQLSDSRSNIDPTVLHRLSTIRRPITLPAKNHALSQRTHSEPVSPTDVGVNFQTEVEGEGRLSKKDVTSSSSSPLAVSSSGEASLKLGQSSKTFVDRFTGSIRQLRLRAGSWLSNQPKEEQDQVPRHSSDA